MTWQGWHFLPDDRRLANGDGREVVAGETYTVEPPIELCSRGLHASKRAIDALYYAPGSIVCRVELAGEILEESDKACATERKVLWVVDADHLLHEFACRVAEDALKQANVTDVRSWAAIEMKRKWLRGECTDAELDAARAAARAAAKAAARAAVWDAAKAAARAAVWDAAKAAVWAAVWAAAWDATRDKYNGWLEEMIHEAHAATLETTS